MPREVHAHIISVSTLHLLHRTTSSALPCRSHFSLVDDASASIFESIESLARLDVLCCCTQQRQKQPVNLMGAGELSCPSDPEMKSSGQLMTLRRVASRTSSRTQRRVAPVRCEENEREFEDTYSCSKSSSTSCIQKFEILRRDFENLEPRDDNVHSFVGEDDLKEIFSPFGECSGDSTMSYYCAGSGDSTMSYYCAASMEYFKGTVWW